MRPINVISLFNGMSTGRQALKNIGIPVNKYYSSEIKPAAIKLTQFHFPETIQLGDINNWKKWDIDYSNIDIVLSGSPCKDLSVAGKRKGLDGSNSSLFWVFIEILKHIQKVNPNVLFFQENVGSANKKDVLKISQTLNVLPVRFNSSLLTAQLRDRYYWSNIKTRTDWTGYIYTDFPKPEDKKIMFRDILEKGHVNKNKCQALLSSESKTFAFKDVKKFNNYIEKREKQGKQLPPIVFVEKKEVRVKTNTTYGYDVLTENDCLNLAFPTSKTRRGRVTKGKSPCLLSVPEQLYCLENYSVRLLTKIELLRLQGFPDNYCEILTRNQTANLVGDGWTLPMIKHFFSFIPDAIKKIDKKSKYFNNEII